MQKHNQSFQVPIISPRLLEKEEIKSEKSSPKKSVIQRFRAKSKQKTDFENSPLYKESSPHNNSEDSSFGDMNESEERPENGETPINTVKDVFLCIDNEKSLKMRSISNIHLAGIQAFDKSKTQQIKIADRKRCVSYYERWKSPSSVILRGNTQKIKSDKLPSNFSTVLEEYLGKESAKIKNCEEVQQVSFYKGIEDLLPSYDQVKIQENEQKSDFKDNIEIDRYELLKIHMNNIIKSISNQMYEKPVKIIKSCTIIQKQIISSKHNKASLIFPHPSMLGYIDEIGRFTIDLQSKHNINLHSNNEIKQSKKFEKTYIETIGIFAILKNAKKEL